MAQPTQVKLRGVHTHSNRLSEVPEGALARAQNAILDRESLIEPRRGMPFYGSAIVAPGGTCRQLIPYGDKLIAHVGSTLYRDDGTGTWTSYSGTFSEIETPYRLRHAQSNKNLYITSSTGIRKLDVITGTWVDAGAPAFVSGDYSLTGASGFMQNGTAVGYQATLFYVDANSNEIVSAPSSRIIAINEAGGSRNVIVTMFIPSGLSTSYYWRLYRSAQTEAAADSPSEEVQLVAEERISSTDISNGFVQVTDATIDSLRGAKLYTNPSEEGAANANARPPIARDLCEFRGYMLYANYTGRHRYFLTLLGAGFGVAATGLRSYSTAAANFTNGSAIVNGITSTATLRAGMRVDAPTGVPGTARILSVDSAVQITMTINATATVSPLTLFQDVVKIAGLEYFASNATVQADREFNVSTGSTPAVIIRNAAVDLVKVVNNDASALVYAFYVSGFDDRPGEILFETRTIGGAQFQLSSNATDAWIPELPLTADGSQQSTADRKPNFVISSKLQQPEAVPLAAGLWSGKTTIQRILALRDAVIVLSDVVGVIQGNSPDNFSYEELDSTVKLVGPATAVVLNDAVYCMSTQGVVRITTQGVQIASRAIEKDLVRALAFTSFADRAFGVAYESDRAYHLWVQTDSSDTVPDYCWRHNAFTQAWTHNDLAASIGIVNPADDKLYIVDMPTQKARKERKSFDSSDYADQEFACTISGSFGTLVVVNSTTGMLDGDLLVQGANRSRIVDVFDATTLLVTDNISWSVAAATVYRPITVVVDPVPVAFGNPGIVKHVPETTFLFRDARFDAFTVGFATNFVPNLSTYVVSLEPASTNSAWGVNPAGSDITNEQPVRTYVPQEVQRGHWHYLSMTFAICRETMALAGISFKARPLSQRFQGAV